MDQGGKSDAERHHELTLMIKQSLKYAEDIAKVYEEEKAKRKELEQSNRTLRREIAERKRAEDALRESEERFRAIFETATDCIYIKDLDLKYTHVNPALAELFQAPPEQIIGKTDDRFFDAATGRHMEATDRRVLEGEFIEEEHTRTVKGAEFTFLDTKAPLRSSSGRIIGLCGIARNITERKGAAAPAPAGEYEYPSRSMRAVLDQARLVAAQEAVVLLLGESGSGKDFLARFIHDSSHRAAGPFFTVNCASVAPELAESELFGHESGAFTGARARKRGLLELAEGGSLFLNEIGELSAALQAKLLTFLDTRAFTRVGGERNISVNARLITATNRDLERETEEGRFRRDLFYRLNVVSIRIPPLRERKEDIPILVRQILARLGSEIRLHSDPVIEADVIEGFKNHDWPGNVRELRNLLERALILSGGGRLTLADFGLDRTTRSDWAFTTEFPVDRNLNDVTKDLKRALVLEGLRRTDGNRSEAARLLGISRNSLNHYLSTLDIKA